MISIFCQFCDSWMRHWDGWCGIFYMPGCTSNLDVINQGHEGLGPKKDNSVEILHCNPPPLYTSTTGTIMEDTGGLVYLDRTVSTPWGGGDTSYLIDHGTSGINSLLYIQEYGYSPTEITHRYKHHFLMTGTTTDSYYGVCALGTLQIDTYDVNSGVELYLGSIWGHYEGHNNSISWLVDGNTTKYSDTYYWSGTPFRRFFVVDGQCSLMSPRVAMLRARTYFAVDNPEPIGLRWHLFDKIMGQLDDNCNSIANIKDVVDALKTIKEYGPAGLVKSAEDIQSLGKAASNAWLAYRYSYSTTKMDVEEYRRAIKTLNECPLEQSVVYHSSQDDYNLTVRLVRHMPKDLEGVVQKFRQLGIDPSAENLWDLIPFSFVVDWFVPLGNMFHDVGKDYYYDNDLYTFQSVCFSRQYWGSSPIGNITYFVRDVSLNPPERLWYSEPASSKSVVRHVIDGLSLIISRGKE